METAKRLCRTHLLFPLVLFLVFLLIGQVRAPLAYAEIGAARQKAAAAQSDALTLGYGGLNEATQWLKLEDNGAAQYFRYEGQRIIEGRAGKVAPQLREAIFQLANTASRQPDRPALPDGPILEGDVLKLRARLSGQQHVWVGSAHQRDALFAAPWFRTLTEKLRQAPAQLSPLRAGGVYGRAEELSPARAANLRARGQFPLVALTAAQLKSYPNLAQALQSPEEFVRLSSSEQAFLTGLLTVHGWFFANYAGKAFQLSRFTFAPAHAQ